MITFIAPDLPRPSGGLRVIHDLAGSLEKMGFPARVWHGGRYQRAAQDLPAATTVCADELTLHPGDLLVMTEVGGAKWALEFSEVPVVMNVQGSDFVFAGVAGSPHRDASYPGWPQVSAVLVASRTLEDFMGEVLQGRLPLHRVPVVVDADLFRPLPKERLVTYMPRRRSEDVAPVLELLRRRPELDDWRIEPIDGLDRSGVAQMLGRSAIFLSGAEREGFGLPGAEAMAAGAAVVGYTGHGGLEYMADGRADVIAESDVVAMARAVLAQARRFEGERLAWDGDRKRSRAYIAQEFSVQARDEAARAAFEELTADGSAALLSRSVVLRHFSAHRVRGPVHRAEVAIRTAAGRLKRRLASG